MVTVVIPTLNEERRVAAAVRSALEAGASEVIVVDGGSTDATVRIAERRYDLRGLARGAEIIEEEEVRSRFSGEPLLNVNTPEELESATVILSWRTTQ